MKFNILTAIASVLILFSSCESELEQELIFDVSVAPATAVQIGDTVVTAPKGTTLQFDFKGEPDFISFSFDRFNHTKSMLTFSTQPAWGTHIENTLNVFLFETSDTLLLNNPTKDAETITNRKWKDITSQCNLSTAANTTKKASVSLNEYRGKKVCLAFRYKTDFEADWQPTWIISNLQINDTVINSGVKAASTFAATMGFSPFDMLNLTAPYLSQDLAGVWNLANSTALQIKRTAANNPLNTDWLISKPIEIVAGVHTLSAVNFVKNTTKTVESYSYKFDVPGEYVITFFASNANYKREISTERKIKVIVTE